MSTNYYLKPIPAACECCGRDFPVRHIGKSSYGWCFTLHVYPDEGINTLEDWRAYKFNKFHLIKDEYGRYVTAEEMLKIITQREFNNGVQPSYSAEEKKRNHAVDGPNGLWRHEIDDSCIGHGEGTWDYCVGDFS